MWLVFNPVVVILINLSLYSQLELDLVNCGIDHEEKVAQGKVTLSTYPWVGILYYSYMGDGQESRAVTTVVLIHRVFVIGCTADIGPMPKKNFRRNSRVLLGSGWLSQGHRVRNYVLHPEYGETQNTIALIHLKDTTYAKEFLKPVCPPPNTLRNPIFYVIKFESDYNNLQKEVIPVAHVPSGLCRDFYITANLYQAKLRPHFVACAVSLDEDSPCVWNAGSALVARDVWGRWQLLGLGTRGPGCGAPSRYLDMGSYYPWIEDAIRKFATYTISKINQHKYVIRSSGKGAQFTAVTRYGDCDEEERELTLQYRELIRLHTDSKAFQFFNYNMTLRDTIRFECLEVKLTNATASSQINLVHICPGAVNDKGKRTPCHMYLGSALDMSFFVMYTRSCMFEMFAWGDIVDMTLLDVQKWKWEEGTYYDDFTATEIEYRGQSYMTDFGFEPLDRTMWIPDYDSWTTLAFDNSTPSTTMKHIPVSNYIYIPSTTTTTKRTTTTVKTKKTWKKKNRTTTTVSTTTPKKG